MRGDGGIPIGGAHEFPDKVIHISSNVARLGKLGDIGLDEWHADELGQDSDEVGLPDSRGAEKDDVLFYVIRHRLSGGGGLFRGVSRVFFPTAKNPLYVVVMIADRHREGSLRFVLADDESIEVGLYLGGGHVKVEDGLGDYENLLLVLLLGRIPHGVRADGEGDDISAELVFDEVLDLFLEFLRTLGRFIGVSHDSGYIMGKNSGHDNIL